eukprot:PhM_4_TR4343/c0_g1_i1/m.70485
MSIPALSHLIRRAKMLGVTPKDAARMCKRRKSFATPHQRQFLMTEMIQVGQAVHNLILEDLYDRAYDCVSNHKKIDFDALDVPSQKHTARFAAHALFEKVQESRHPEGYLCEALRDALVNFNNLRNDVAEVFIHTLLQLCVYSPDTDLNTALIIVKTLHHIFEETRRRIKLSTGVLPPPNHLMCQIDYVMYSALRTLDRWEEVIPLCTAWAQLQYDPNPYKKTNPRLFRQLILHDYITKVVRLYDMPAAVRMLKEVLEEDPEFTLGMRSCVVLQMDQGDIKGAGETLDRLMRIVDKFSLDGKSEAEAARIKDEVRATYALRAAWYDERVGKSRKKQQEASKVRLPRHSMEYVHPLDIILNTEHPADYHQPSPREHFRLDDDPTPTGTYQKNVYEQMKARSDALKANAENPRTVTPAYSKRHDVLKGIESGQLTNVKHIP